MLHPKLLELQKQFKPSILTPIDSPLFEQKQLECWIKRDDLIHPIISGNKWRKLKYILNHALNIEADTLISMGGAYSNHLHALAFAGRALNLKTIGFIRGEQPKVFSPTLEDLKRWGMELRFVSRTEYRELRQYKTYNQLPNSIKGQYWLPEGGATDLALRGVGEIVSEIEMEFDTLCVPCGTGTTLAGLIGETEESQSIIGFSALKGGGFLMDDVNNLLITNDTNNNWSIQLDYHFGGFAKRNNELLLFIEDFAKQHRVQLEPVYSGKMVYGLLDLIKKDFFKAGQKIIILHTGGLQGSRSLDVSIGE